MAVIQLPDTKLPRLDSLAIIPPSTASFETVSQQLPRIRRDAHQLLRAFARFLLAFTGDDDVSWDFTLCVDHQHASIRPLPPSGTARAVSTDAPSLESELEILETANTSASDFGIFITDQDHISPPRSLMNQKPFLVLLSEFDCTLRYASGRIPSSLITPLFDALITYLNLAASPKTNIKDLSVLNHPPASQPPEFEGLLGLRISAAERSTSLLHAVFSARVKDYPERPALDFLDHTGRVVYTYRRLDDLSTALSQRIRTSLATRGCKDCKHIAVLLPPSPELYLAWLGVLKAGCTFCPLSIESPSALLSSLVTDLEARMILSSARGPSTLEAVLEASPTLEYMDLGAPFQESPSTCLAGLAEHVDTNPDDIAYIVYTSGSTGRPKGVQVTHLGAACAVAANIEAAADMLRQYESGPRWFQFAAPTFDASVAEIFITLSVGGTVCACDRAMLLTDPEAAMAELRAESIMTTPSMASLLRPDRMPSLRHLWSIGEVLNARIMQNFAATESIPSWKSSRCLVNTYGPTETTINYTIDNVSSSQRESIIGSALSTCSLFLLDPSRHSDAPVPLAFSGELAIGGPQVSAGYLRRPEQDAQSFVDIAPFGRVYRTGDRVRIVQGLDGSPTIDFLGRISSGQVKINGRRVELGEIEAAVTAPSVTEAAVVYMPPNASSMDDRTGTQTEAGQIIAVVVPRQPGNAGSILAECRKSMARRLLPFMWPTQIYSTRELPRTDSHKIDRKALQRLCLSPNEHGLVPLSSEKTSIGPPQADATEANISTATAKLMERVIKAIYRTIQISVTDVNASTTLLSLGIDSLRVVRLLQRARDEGLPSLKFADALACGSVHNLVLKYQELETESSEAATLARRERLETLLQTFQQRHRAFCLRSLGIDDAQVESILPATTSQAITLASFVLSSKPSLEKGMSTSFKSKAYVQHTVLELADDFDMDRLATAWASVLGRYDIMRTVFVQVDDEMTPFAQCVLRSESATARLEKPTRTRCAADDDFDEAVRQATQRMEHGIRLEKPPWALTLIECPNRKAVVHSILHPIFDGASFRMLLTDVEREYLGRPVLVRGGVLTAVKKHFSEDRVEAAFYWKQQLGDLTPPSFPCICITLPSSESPRCSIHRFDSCLAVKTLERKAAQMQSSPLSVLQMAWAMILFAYTGEAEVVFGNAVSDRFTDEMENCAAPTLAIHPIRVALDTDSKRTNTEMTRMTTEGNARAFQNLHAPISSAKYDTVFAFQQFAGSSGEEVLYRKVSTLAMENDQSVMIEVYETRPGLLEFVATCKDSLVDEAAAQMMLSDLARIATEIIEKPQQLFSDLRFLPKDSLAKQTQEPTVSRKTLLHHHFERQARETPDALALAFHWSVDSQVPPVELTYQQLDRNANHLASIIRTRLCGRSKPHVVPIFMEKCPELYVAVLAVLKSGAAWCPIDPQYPPARQRYLMEKTMSDLVLVAGETAQVKNMPSLPPGFEAINVEIRTELAGYAKDIACLDATASDIAYVIFTSGTTGVPKGVPITHEAATSSITSFVNEISKAYPEGSARYLQFANFTFDVFVRDLFAAWQLGGTLVSATRGILLSSFAALANKARATHASMTPTFASTLRSSDFPSLRVLTLGGESLPQALADEWKDAVALFNIYGPAETAINVTARRVSPNLRSSNVGLSLPTVAAWVMRDNQPLLNGAIGELVISGPQLSPGYWTDSGVTEAKFVWNDFLQQRVYHTGDMVRRLSDGSFDFVGRNDNLVKIRGMRVELSEIAAVCAAGSPLVIHAEVLLTPLPGSLERSVVCFLDLGHTKSNSTDGKSRALNHPAAQEIRRSVAQRAAAQLPQYMVPDIFVVLSSFPRTASAKVDGKQLLDILVSSWEQISPLDAKTNGDGTEAGAEWGEENRPIVESIIQFAKIRGRFPAPSTTLIELGLDSIAAIKLSSRLRVDGNDVSAVDILACRNVGEIVDLTTRSQLEDSAKWREMSDKFDEYWRPAVTLALKRRTENFRLAPSTPMQDGVLVESLRDPSSYWGVFAWRLSEDVDCDRLREAWQQVMTLNEILRVGFLSPAAMDFSALKRTPPLVSSTFLQVILEETNLPWNEKPISGDLQSSVEQLSHDMAEKHYPLGFSNPPWQVSVLRTAEVRFMILTIHHSLYDGDVIRHLMRDLELSYQDSGYRSKRCQLQETMGRLAAHRDDTRSLEFWTEELQAFKDESDVEDDAAKKLDKREITHRTTEMRASLSKAQLGRAAAEFGVSSFNSLLRVAYGSMLAELAESERTLLAEIRSERLLEAKFADAMAPLVSVYPVPVRMSGTPRQMVRVQAELASRSIEVGPIHPGQLRKLIHKRADETLLPAVYTFHPHIAEESSTALWQPVGDPFDLSVDHAFALNVFETADDGVLLSLAIDETIMSAAAQETMLRELDSLVANVVLHPDVSSMLHLVEYFPPDLISVSESIVPEGFRSPVQPTHHIEWLAEQYPDWKAVEVVTEFRVEGLSTVSWTFQQLNKAANKVAHFIQRRGLADRTVAMSLSRDLMSFAVILGIFKSGNVYVPIEMSLPAERQSFILGDSGAAMLFTEGVDPNVRLPGDDFSLVTVGPLFLDSLDDMSDNNPVDQGSAELDAYFIYTSGSTGNPKGVRISRSNLSSFVDAFSQLMCTEAPVTRELGGSGSYLCLASRAFDVHLAEMFLAWRHGMCAATGDRFGLLDNLGLALKELHITHASFVPSLLDQTGLTPDDAPDLVYLGVGGEKMTPQTQRVWASSDRISLINAYGPTEVTIGCCSARLHADSDTRNIGAARGDTTAHVLVPGTDVHTKKGMPGELVLCGSLVGNGYHNRPDATGFCVFDDQPAYKTGDIVRMELDGAMLFLGRKDDQVKLRGQRLELGEVSQAVKSASSEPIDVATLVLRHPEMPRQSLVSFVAASGGAAAGATRGRAVFLGHQYAEVESPLKRACEASLPAYMVPDFVLPVSTLPLTETAAKTDNKLLANIFRSIPLNRLCVGRGTKTDGQAIASPRRTLNDREKKVVAVVASVLPQRSDVTVTPDTTVLQLGVDSISAVNITFKLKRLGLHATVGQILRNQSIEQLASSLWNSAAHDKGDEVEEYQDEELQQKAVKEHLDTLAADVRRELKEQAWPHADDTEAVWPCLPLQEVLVAHSLAQEPGSDAKYVGHVLLNLGPSAGMDRVRKAWEMVVRENSILRTCFYCRKRDVVQVVKTYSDFTEWSVSTADAAAARWNTITGKLETLRDNLENLSKTISVEMVANMQRIPPIRFTLASAEIAPNKSQPRFLMLSMHHGLYDMGSLGLLIADAEIAYAQGCLQKRPSTTRLMHHTAAQNRRQEKAKKYWEDLFQGWDRKLSPQPPSSGLGEPRLARRQLKMGLGAMEKLCGDRGFTLPGLMQGLFAYVLTQTAGKDDISYGVVLSGRSVDVDGINEMRAPCITTLPQRLRLEENGNNSLANLVSSVQEQLFRSMDHQYTSLRSISSWLAVSGPLFSSIFTMVRTRDGDDGDKRSHKVFKYVQGHMPLEYPFAVECSADGATDEVVLRAQCRIPGLFKDVEGFVEKMEKLVDGLLRGRRLAVFTHGINGMKGANGTNGTNEMNGDSEPCVPAVEDDHWTPLEETIRDAITSYSSTPGPHIDRDTPFIKFGIDSITTIRFAKLLAERGVRVSGADVIRNPSVRALAKHASSLKDGLKIRDESAKTSNGSSKGLDLLAGNVPSDVLSSLEAAYPLTPLQVGMVTATLTLNPRLYSYHHTLSLPVDTSVPRLKQAWCALLQHHDILRTSLVAPQGKLTSWIGAVHAEPKLKWRGVKTDRVEETIHQVMAETEFADAASFANPPVGATVVQSASEMVLVLSLHHCTYDAVSINFIFEDLARLYRDMASLPCRRPFYEAALTIWRQSRQSTDFWISHISGYKGAAIPLEENEERRTVLNTCSRILHDVAAIEEWCVEAGMTMQSLIFLALGKALCSIAGVRDIVIGQVVAGRVAIEEADMVAGPMFNTLPFRLCLSDASASNLDYLQELQGFYNQSLDHQHGSLMDVQRAWRGNNGELECDLFDTLFVFQKEGEATWTRETTWRPYEFLSQRPVATQSHYRLSVEVDQKADGSLAVLALSKMAQDKLHDFVRLFGECFSDIYSSPERLAVAFPDNLPGLPVSPEASAVSNGAEISFEPEAIRRKFLLLKSVLCDVIGETALDITPQTNIYSFGIDSVIAIRVAGACRKAGVLLSTADMIRNPKMGRLCEVALANSKAAEIARKTSAKTEEPVGRGMSLLSSADVEKALSILGREPSTVEEVLPLLPGQEYLLALWLRSGKTRYEPTWVLRAKDKVNFERLLRSWSLLRRRFTTLRSCFVAVRPDTVLQVVLNCEADEADNSVEVIESGNFDLEQTVRNDVRRAYRSPSSLYHPPSRLKLVKGGQGEGDALVLTLHHATYDGWSIGLLIAELSTLYEKGGFEGESTDMQKSRPMPTFSCFVREICAVGERKREEEKRFWRIALGDGDATIVGKRDVDKGVREFSSKTGELQLKRHSTVVDCSDVSVEAVEAAARKTGVTAQSIVVAAFAQTLCATSTASDETHARSSVVFGYWTAGRTAAFDNMEALPGPTVNMLPVMVPVRGKNEASHVRALQEMLSARTEYEQSRLRDVLHWARTDNKNSSSPSEQLFNAHLNILWNDEILLTTPSAKHAHFQPWNLGPQADFIASSDEVNAVESAIDGLDVEYLPMGELHVDIGPAPVEEGVGVLGCRGLRIGAGCDAGMMGVGELEEFLGVFGGEIGRLVNVLSQVE